jgi:hypothetical protein
MHVPPFAALRRHARGATLAEEIDLLDARELTPQLCAPRTSGAS